MAAGEGAAWVAAVTAEAAVGWATLTADWVMATAAVEMAMLGGQGRLAAAMSAVVMVVQVDVEAEEC